MIVTGNTVGTANGARVGGSVGVGSGDSATSVANGLGVAGVGPNNPEAPRATTIASTTPTKASAPSASSVHEIFDPPSSS